MTVALERPVERAAPWRQDRPRILLAVICALHAIAPLILVGPHFWYEWDETVNISQVSKHAPAGLFTAPRARGMPILLYPLTELTYSTAALRVYLAVLSSIGLYLAFRPWLRLRPGYVVPLAAGLFTTLWVTIYYGFEAMPNLYVAIGAVAATAHFLLAVREPERRRHLLALAAWLVFLGLLRPSDAIYTAVPLGLAALVLRGMTLRTRGLLVGAIGVGVVLGWLEWVVEAYVSYGGFLNRLHAASAENNGGLHMSLGLEARALVGPTLCRPCTRPVVWHAVLWWFVVPPLVALGIWALRRTAARLAVLPTAVALFLLFQYVVTVDYAAPRFLLPTYALLALPAAEGAARLARPHATWWRPRIVIPVLGVALLLHLAAQLIILNRAILPEQTSSRLQYLTVVHDLRAHGISQPCLVIGYYAAPIAFGAGCNDVPTLSHTARVLAKSKDGRTDIAVLTPRLFTNGAFYTRWPVHRVHGPHLRHPWYVYFHRAGT